MATSMPDPVLSAVKSMTYFIIRLYYKKKDKSKLEKLGEVSNLPLPMESFIRNFYNKHKDEYDRRRCPYISPSASCMGDLMEDLTNFLAEPKNDINDSESLLAWCCKICLKAADLFEHDYADAPELAIGLIMETFKKDNRYKGFFREWL